MANDINSVIIIGNLTKDCGAGERDFVYTQSGTAIASVDIASNRAKKQADGTWADEVSFFPVKIYGKTAENLKPYLKKGQKIAVEGVLKQERWQDKDGKNQSRIVINAMSVQLVGGRKESDNSPASSEPMPQSNYAKEYNAQNSDSGYEEDIPF